MRLKPWQSREYIVSVVCFRESKRRLSPEYDSQCSSMVITLADERGWSAQTDSKIIVR